MQTKKFGLFTTHSLTNFSIYCSIFTYLETTEWIFNLSACYNQFPFIFTNTFLDIMHEISFEVDGGREEMGGETYRKVPSINTSRLEACFRFYRLMKGKFDVYLLQPFKEKLIS